MRVSKDLCRSIDEWGLGAFAEALAEAAAKALSADEALCPITWPKKLRLSGIRKCSLGAFAEAFSKWWWSW